MTGERTKRVEEIDILKAIAIILMVIGHSGAPPAFIFLFHMAVFFIASGFTYKPRSSDSFGDVMDSFVKRIRRLWVPYFFWCTLFTLLNNWLIRVNIYTDNPELFTYTDSIRYMNLNTSLSAYMTPGEMIQSIAKHVFFQGAPLLVNPLWFVGTLFLISNLYTLIDWFIKRYLHKDPLIPQAVAALALLFIGRYIPSPLLGALKLDRMASCYHLYFIGVLLNRFRKLYAGWNAKQYLPALVLSFGVLMFLHVVVRNKDVVMISLSSNQYPNPAVFLLASLSGWVFCYSIAWFLKHTPLRPVMLFIGKRTLPIVIFHYLSFKIVNAVVLSVRHLPSFCLAAHPHLYGDQGLWWVAFTAVGVAVPLLLSVLYEQAKRRLCGIRPTGAK